MKELIEKDVGKGRGLDEPSLLSGAGHESMNHKMMVWTP